MVCAVGQGNEYRPSLLCKIHKHVSPVSSANLSLPMAFKQTSQEEFTLCLLSLPVSPQSPAQNSKLSAVFFFPLPFVCASIQRCGPRVENATHKGVVIS